MKSAWLGRVIGAVVVCSPGLCYAERAPILYSAPLGCPSADEVNARAQTPGDKSAAIARIDIIQRRGVYRGQVTVGADSNVRALEGANCAELVDALLLVIAVAGDVPSLATSAAVATSSASAPPSEERQPSASSSALANAQPAALPASPRMLPITASRPAGASENADTANRASRAPSRGALRAAIGVATGIAGVTERMTTLEVHASLERAARGVWQPSVRVRMARSLPTSTANGPANVDLAWTFGEVDFAVAALSRGDFRIAPHAGVQLGALSVSPGSGLAKPSAKNRLWTAATAVVRGTWAMSRSFSVDADCGVLVPWTRDTIVVAPQLSMYRAAAVSPLVRLTASVVF